MGVELDFRDLICFFKLVHKYLGVLPQSIPGHIFGPDRVGKKPDAKNTDLGPARPDYRARNISPSLARGVFFLSGHRAGPS
jgi:hypothetical protein